MAVQTTPEDWKKNADKYKGMTGDLNVKPIGVMLECLNSRYPLNKAVGILDDGCGPGPIMARIIDEHGANLPESCTLTCSDFAAGMVEQANKTKETAIAEHGSTSLWNKVNTEVLDSMDLKTINDDALSHVAAGWSFFNAKSPLKALTEARRVLQPGGVLAASSWAETDWLKIVKAISKIDPSHNPPAIPDEWANATNLKAHLEDAAYRDVEVHEVPVDIPFRTYDSFVEVMLTRVTQMMAASRDLPEEKKAVLRGLMKEEMQNLCPTEPGVLKGLSLVAVGVK